ncbi:MAG: hypothetical protein IJS08_17785 [Victivallales bacterium]|nr:hypothetical protein [Victivallales bacterium]
MAHPEISLAQFNKIATGSYNAGLVDFETDKQGNLTGELTKVNNHVHRKALNKVVLSPERIVEVKEAFIAALRKGGVSEDNIRLVREKLGIPAELSLTSDKETLKGMLRQRLKPLSRQDVRELLDTYANQGKGFTQASRSSLSYYEWEEGQRTASISGSALTKRNSINQEAIALDNKEGKVDYKLTDAIFMISAQRPLEDLNNAQRARFRGVNAVNERNVSTIALQTSFATLFDKVLSLQSDDVQDTGTFRVCGMDVEIVKGQDGKLTAIVGSGESAVKVPLDMNADDYLAQIIGRAVVDKKTLGGPLMKNLLDKVYDRDLENGILASDRHSVTRQFACLILEQEVQDAWNLGKGEYNTGILVDIAQHTLISGNEAVNTKAKLDAYHAKLVQDNAGLPDDMKAMLEPVANLPLGKPDADDSEFKVSAPIVGDINQIANVHVPQGPVPAVHKDIGGMAGIKDFVADLVFSDDTMFSDVKVDRPGEKLRKVLSDDKKMNALAEIIKNTDVLEFAVAPEIKEVVVEGFTKMKAILDEECKKATGETLAQMMAKPDGLERFSLFFKDADKLHGSELAKFDNIIQTMANKGCEKLQSFINEVFNVNVGNANDVGALTTDPYKNMTAKQIKDLLDGKNLNQILDSASTSEAPGQVGFFKQVVSTYFTQLSKADKRSCFAAAMRYAGTYEFGNMQGQELVSAKKAATNKFTGAILKGTSPLLQKMMQGLPKEIMGEFADALADMKSNLAPIPRKVVQAHLMKMISDSNGKIKSIELKKSLGAASVGEAFLCQFKYVAKRPKMETVIDPETQEEKEVEVKDNEGNVVMEDYIASKELVVKIMRHDAEIRVNREAQIFTEAAKKIPGMEKTWEGQLNQYMKEFDFTREADNVNEGVTLYDIANNEDHALQAIAPEVASMKMSDLVPPQKNAMVCEVALGHTVDSYFKRTTEDIRGAAAPVFERDPVTNRIKWEDKVDPQTGEKVVDPQTGQTVKVPVFKQNLPATAIPNMQMWLSSKYDDLQRASDKLLQATKAWFHEAILGSGKFHGDTHSGNLMVSGTRITFIDFGNLYKLESNRPDGVNERQELLRVIMGSAFRNKEFFLNGLEKLLSPEGKAALAANRDKAEAILDSVLDKSKGGVSFNMVYRLQASIVELQKLGIELPPQINCFIQSMVRLSNTVAEMNTIMNQCKAMLDASKAVVQQPPQRDELDMIGKAFDVFASEDGKKLVKTRKNEKGEGHPSFLDTIHTEEFGGRFASMSPMFKEGGSYYNKVLERLHGDDPIAAAGQLKHLIEQHVTKSNDPNFPIVTEVTFNSFNEEYEKFLTDYAKAETPEAKEAAIKKFARSVCYCEANILTTLTNGFDMLASAKFDNPMSFASAINNILFSNFNTLKQMLPDEAERTAIGLNARSIARDELNLSFLDSFDADKIIGTLLKDAEKMGGDKDYKVDIGV